ncbi:MAG: response regulator [Cytophagales bacterium]|nr:response regulator [Cytophagales bacterium]
MVSFQPIDHKHLLNEVSLGLFDLLANTNFEEAANAVLERIGKACLADRAYLYQVSQKANTGTEYIFLKNEWVREGVTSMFLHPSAVESPFGNYPEFVGPLKNNLPYSGLTSNYKGNYLAVLQELGVKSNLVIPVFIRGKFWGFIGFDDCSYERIWEESEISALRLVATSIGEAFSRNNYELQLTEARLQAEEAKKAKEDFLSIMSHEIKTPLNSVIGMSHILLKRTPRPDQLKILETLNFSANNLLKLINDILDFNKIEAKMVEIEEIQFSLKDLLNKIKDSYFTIAQDKGILLKISMDPNIPAMLFGDTYRLTQIFNNLLDNAIKFTSMGKVNLKVKMEREDDTFYHLTFIITDTGIGIPEEKLVTIFEPFTQASSDTTRKYGGTGLGLSIIKNLVELMEGSVSLKSVVNKGSTFTLQIPFRKTQKKSMQKSALNKKITQDRSLKGVKVLYVDDISANQFLLRELTSDWNLDLDIASSGHEALEKIKNKPYDLVLMDIYMPEMDGYETTRQIRGFEEEYFEFLPIIAVSASVSDMAKSKVLERGMNDYINKPIDPDQLYQTIAQYSGKHN